MKTFHLPNQLFSRLVSILMCTATCLVIAQPKITGVSSLVNYAEWIALGFTGFGLLMVAFKQPKVMLVSMACAATICLYFDKSETPVISQAQTKNSPQVSISHANLSNHDGRPIDLLQSMVGLHSDVLTLIEYTPGWDSLLKKELESEYPYCIKRSRLGYGGMAIYAHMPILPLDSFETTDACMYAIKLQMSHQIGDVAIFLNTIPIIPGSRSSFLDTIQNSVKNCTLPCLVVGDFNTPNWDNTIMSFCEATKLHNSHVGTMVTDNSLFMPGFKIPSEHIFYSHAFDCTEFQPISNAHASYIGLHSSYRLKPMEHAL